MIPVPPQRATEVLPCVIDMISKCSVNTSKNTALSTSLYMHPFISPSINLFIHLYIHSSHPFLSFIIHSSIYDKLVFSRHIQYYIELFVPYISMNKAFLTSPSSIHLSIYPSLHTSINLSIHPVIYLSIQSYIYPSIHISINSSIPLSHHSFINTMISPVELPQRPSKQSQSRNHTI